MGDAGSDIAILSPLKKGNYFKHVHLYINICMYTPEHTSSRRIDTQARRYICSPAVSVCVFEIKKSLLLTLLPKHIRLLPFVVLLRRSSNSSDSKTILRVFISTKAFALLACTPSL
ncbi:unnamed protein product [Ceratitis capitata]|uniref:(Mediterranean fruit fly) hypothetical protein n=1 Tax=Ceratitis capitata TaxID=7213 RepID=A0A811TZC0_CERCA|nr:unnamed protein product [Ceratitis capitata]